MTSKAGANSSLSVANLFLRIFSRGRMNDWVIFEILLEPKTTPVNTGCLFCCGFYFWTPFRVVTLLIFITSTHLLIYVLLTGRVTQEEIDGVANRQKTVEQVSRAFCSHQLLRPMVSDCTNWTRRPDHFLHCTSRHGQISSNLFCFFFFWLLILVFIFVHSPTQWPFFITW